jgi:hypothetical protein
MGELLAWWNSLNFFYKFIVGAPIVFVIAAATGLE